MQETWVPSLGGEDPLEKGMPTHSNILTGGKSQGQRSLVGYSPWGHRRVTHNWATKHFLKFSVSSPILVCQPHSGKAVFPLGLEWLFSGEIYSWVMKSSSASYNLCDDIRKRKKWTIYFFFTISNLIQSFSLCSRCDASVHLWSGRLPSLWGYVSLFFCNCKANKCMWFQTTVDLGVDFVQLTHLFAWFVVPRYAEKWGS